MTLFLSALIALAANPEAPKVLDDRLQLQLVAAEPEVVTPTGLAVDQKGRVLVIESHTHFRPEEYKGPPADRILLLEDFDRATGRARKITVFFEGTKHTMNLAVYPDGSIYVATRMEIFRLRDHDHDGRADERIEICHLETPGNYPHNGLSGLAFDAGGNLYFGFGENLGAEYKLIGSDGKSLSGGGEGGNIYCCNMDGKHLRRLATGFWNPFGLGFDRSGHLFAVDNDPDSRPPCRLLHIVEGGDYGFKFRNGRKGVHPFTAWNGELPGTLPMVSGTGEAPCTVLAYESGHLPDEYRGDLLVTSWGDHRLERYRLAPRGASFRAEMTTVLSGNEQFRPVGLAVAPDGSLFMSDWVDKSYPLHGKGRVWRLSAKQPSMSASQSPQPANAMLTANVGTDIRSALRSPDPFVRQAAITSAVESLSRVEAPSLAKIDNALERLGIAIAKRRSGRSERRDVIAMLLKDADPLLRLYGVIWVGEEQITEQREAIEQLLMSGATNRQLFEASLACLDRLTGEAPRDARAESAGEVFTARLLRNKSASAGIRRFAIRSLRADHPVLTMELLTKLLADEDPAIRLEAIRTMRERPEGAWWPSLRELAANERCSALERCEAIVSLSPERTWDRMLLRKLIESNVEEVNSEALRAMRATELTEDERRQIRQIADGATGPRKELAERVLVRLPPGDLPKHQDVAGWLARAAGNGSAAAGERVFYHSRAAGCFRCHEFEGRGHTVGPELSTIGQSMTRERLVQSLVDPSREIAPQFTSYTILKRDGEVLTGIHTGDEVDGRMRYVDQNGRVFFVHPNEVERRQPSSQSIMPEGLLDQLTQQELRDLVAFLLRQ